MINHPWNVSVADAKQIQNDLKELVITNDQIGQIKYVAGVDVGFERNYTITKAAIVVLSYPDLEVVESSFSKIPTQFPYIPGLLSFREIPAILHSYEKLKTQPDVLLCDGQGLAHPRRFGIACHIGLIKDIPSIGVAKKLLIGKHDDVPDEKGKFVNLTDNKEIIGAVLRSRAGVKPIFISQGHKISLKTSLKIVNNCITKYRLPETTRLAHNLASNI